MGEQFQRLRELSAGYDEWQVRKDDGIVAWFNHTMSPTPERDARSWLQNHQREYPARFAGYEVRKERVYTEIQQEALALLAELDKLRADARRYRAFFDAGLPITFLGESYETKEELDAAIDATTAEGGDGGA